MAQPKIGVFDSGVGGFSIVECLREQLSNVVIDYCLDQLNFPYGTKTAEEVLEFSSRACREFKNAANLDLLVVACNTASTIALDEIRKQTGIPVVGVVPAVKPAAHISATKEIAVLATKRAAQQPYLHKLIEDFASDCKVHLIGSAHLVELAERKVRGLPFDLETIEHEVAEIKRHPNVDTLVLGCTHFPLLKKELTAVLGESVAFLDSGEAVTRQVLRLLEKVQLERSQIKPRSAVTAGLGYTTGDVSMLWSNAEKPPSYVASLGFSSWRALTSCEN
jgi:glutamate racemase